MTDDAPRKALDDRAGRIWRTGEADPDHAAGGGADAGPPAFYSRPGLNVETYERRTAVELPGTTVAGDIGFYTTIALECRGPVLELGCGTGRVAWALATAGVEVVGLDRSRAMLDIAQGKRASADPLVAGRVRFVLGDMVSFHLAEAFRLVIAPFRAFQGILEPADQRRSLEASRGHLEPGGRLVLDLFDPRLDLCTPSDGAPLDRRPTNIRHPLSRNLVRARAETRSNDPLRQVLEERWRFTESDDWGQVIRDEVETLRMRWTYRQEMRYLLESSGFEVEDEYGDFRGSPPTYGAEQVWVARRTGPGVR